MCGGIVGAALVTVRYQVTKSALCDDGISLAFYKAVLVHFEGSAHSPPPLPRDSEGAGASFVYERGCYV